MHAYAKHHYLNMVLNLGSLSQTDISSILIDNGLRNYGTLAYTADPIKITHTEKEFVKLKMDTKHVSLVTAKLDGILSAIRS